MVLLDGGAVQVWHVNQPQSLFLRSLSRIPKEDVWA
jgi:hypothetical protein